MNRTIKTTAVSAAFFALSLTAQGSLADPLHKFGSEGAWIHVDSGWQFPKDVDGFP